MKTFIFYFIAALFFICSCAVHYSADKSTFDGTLGTHSTIVSVPDSSNISNSNN